MCHVPSLYHPEESNLPYSKQLISVRLSRTRRWPYLWLTELHSKIWGQKNRQQELFTAVEITTADWKNGLQNCIRIAPQKRSIHKTWGTPIVQNSLERRRYTCHTCHSLWYRKLRGWGGEQWGWRRTLFPFPVHSRVFGFIQFVTRDTLLRMPQPLLVRQEYKFLTKRLPDHSAILTSGHWPGTGGMPVFLFHAESHPNTRQGFLPLHSNGRTPWSMVIHSYIRSSVVPFIMFPGHHSTWPYHCIVDADMRHPENFSVSHRCRLLWPHCQGA